MSEFQTLLTRVPTHATTRYPGITLRQAAGAADRVGDPARLSTKSRNLYMAWLRQLYKWANMHDYAKNDPTVVLSEFAEQDVRDARGRFDDEQLRAIFARVSRDKLKAPTH